MATPTGNLIYAHPTDNVVDAVVPTVSRPALTGYSLSNIYDKNPATWYWANAAGSVRFVWDFGTPVNISWATLVLPNIPAGTSGVLLEGNSSASWPGTVSLPIVIPTWAEDGFPWNPFVINPGTTAYRYWSIFVPAFASALSVGEIGLISTFRELPININWDANLNERTLVIEHRTDANVLTEYNRGVRWFELSGEIDGNDTTRTAVRSWIRSASGRAKRFFIIPELTENHAWMVKFISPDLTQQLAFLDWTKLTVGWEELSRGLKP